MPCRFLAQGLAGGRMRGAREAQFELGNCPSRARKLFGAPSLRAFLPESAPVFRAFRTSFWFVRTTTTVVP